MTSGAVSVGSVTNHRKKAAVAPGVYFDPSTRRFSYRPWVNGRRTERILEAGTLKEALREYHQRLSVSQKLCTVGDLIQRYLDAGAPGRRGRERDQEYVKAEAKWLWWPKKFFARIPGTELKQRHCWDYREWRIPKIRAGFDGLRTIDIELGKVSNAIHLAVEMGEMDSNPLAARRRFHRSTEHCRDHCPRSGDELHKLANELLSSPTRASHVLSWQMLFEATSGCRTGEALPLRWDAAPGQPGHIREGRRYLCIARLKVGDDDPYEYITINPALKLVLSAMKNWRTLNMPATPWFFPSLRSQERAVNEGALAHALKRIGPRLLGRRITSHGMRAFYVTWRRVNGVPLTTIADAIGHRSGVQLILTTYGRKVPPWATKEFSPYPKTEPVAWGPWLKLPKNIVRLRA
ncbi:MAG: hypothetical protein L0Z50_36930 [Verrucomicrobiales bacterium]|nr:hypothetical protein [Verrucomicrobiales bacterium]